MGQVLSFVRNITLFLLFGNLLMNLFNGSSYRKYFNYVIGLIVLVLIIFPILTFLTGENTLENYLIQSVWKGQESEALAEIRLAEEQTKEKIRDEYIRQIQEMIRISCGFSDGDCEIELKLSEGEEDFLQIQRVRIFCPYIPVRADTKIRDLSVRLGIPENQIEFLVKDSGSEE